MTPDPDDLYAVLVKWVSGARPQTYGDLSRDYEARTGDWFEPHGSWDHPLGALNQRLGKVGAPALSALVVLQDSSEPGAGFWGSAPNVPQRPRDEVTRLVEWSRIVKDVLAYQWPRNLP